MRVIYAGNNEISKWRKSNEDVLLLLFDRWDDYTYKTRFPTACFVQGEQLEVGALKILFEGENASHKFLAEKVVDGWDREFPVPDANYLSVPEDITFYQQIQSAISPAAAVQIAGVLRDASYLAFVREDPAALQLIQSDGFRVSLQRERSSKNSFTDGWRLLEGAQIEVEDLRFRFRDAIGNLSELTVGFSGESKLPHDINVLIGPNGVGKSWLFRQLVAAWLQPESDHDSLNGAGFVSRPNFERLIAVSYSPFERLPVDVDDEPSVERPLKDKDVYRFFGFRGRDTGRGRIKHSLSVANANAARSLVRCLVDDVRFKSMSAWGNKLATMHAVIGTALDFDFAAVRLSEAAVLAEILVSDPFDEVSLVEEPDADGLVARYLALRPDTQATIDSKALTNGLVPDDGVTFFKEGKAIPLSSGQRLFFYIVVNVLGALRRNSLILVDEPELFLHPTLEVQFVSMLKEILERWNSKAILATHSAISAREVPRDCVHVLERTANELVIKHPPFETFGGDVQRISSYVFGDRAISKPYEDWLRRLLGRYDTAQAVIDALGEDINEEIIIQLHSMERGG